MGNVKIIVDSGCDMTHEEIKQYDFDLVALTVYDGDKQYFDFYEIDDIEYAKHLRVCEQIPTTAQPGPEAFVQYFEKYMNEYDQILAVTMSPGGSGTYHSALMGKELFKEKHPDACCRIEIHDCWSTSMNLALQAMKAHDMLAEGHSLDEVLAELDRIKRMSSTYYLVDNTDFVIKGGRVSSLKGKMITKFRIKPIISIVNGVGANPSMAIGYHNGISKMASYFIKENGGTSKLYIAHVDALSNVKLLVDKIKETIPDLDYQVNQMHATMATHSGPDTVAMFYVRSK